MHLTQESVKSDAFYVSKFSLSLADLKEIIHISLISCYDKLFFSFKLFLKSEVKFKITLFDFLKLIISLTK